MGIYDRDYYRGSRNPILESFARTGQVCKWLIIINVIVFLVQTATAPSLDNPRAAFSLGPVTEGLSLKPTAVFQGQIWRVITCAFLHNPDAILHILFNMLFLWWFGSELESMYGPKEFLTFYLCGAVASSVAFLLYPGLTEWLGPDRGQSSALGASGAVSAIMVLYAFHFPKRVIYLFFVLPVPIWAFVAFSVFRDFLGFLGQLRGIQTSIGVTGHLGGAAFGLLYYQLGLRLSPFFTQFRLPSFQRRRPKLKVVPAEPRYAEPRYKEKPPPSQSRVDEQLEAKVDAVLEKIQKHGEDSLTAEERLILKQASEAYKQRRN